MNNFEAFILGLLQGLTEFLPVSSSGHIELGKHVLGTRLDKDVTFTVVVHAATVLSTLIVFRKDILDLLRNACTFKRNESTEYLLKIGISMIPVAVPGIFFPEMIESFFDGNIVFVGCMLLVTSALLGFTYFAKNNNADITYAKAFIIGIAQAVAVLPGISRSGATIATGLLIGVDKTEVARFSFLMVIIPILGGNFLELLNGDMAGSNIGILPLTVGFFAALTSGLIACRLMIYIVKNSKLIYFSLYCFAVGLMAILF
ncbi:MAG: undecaprenyl-diphosphate phosphatase [Desulfobacteraceae bacterium]|nr:MAG: undecaprenyl-diphosphate phosphatase [Desulfobacteraceae bacterium]